MSHEPIANRNHGNRVGYHREGRFDKIIIIDHELRNRWSKEALNDNVKDRDMGGPKRELQSRA